MFWIMYKEYNFSFLIIFSAFFNKKAKILIFPSFSSYLLENKQSYRISNRIKSFSHTHLHAQAQKSYSQCTNLRNALLHVSIQSAYTTICRRHRIQQECVLCTHLGTKYKNILWRFKLFRRRSEHAILK